MDRARLSPYPHYSWFAHWLAVRPPRVFELYEDRYVTHRLLLTTAGDADLAWNQRGNDLSFHSTVGDIGFYPCDHAVHGLAITAATGFEAYAMLLPEGHLRAACVSDGMRLGPAGPAVPVFRDPVIRACLLRLAGGGTRQISEDVGDEIAPGRSSAACASSPGAEVPTGRKTPACSLRPSCARSSSAWMPSSANTRRWSA